MELVTHMRKKLEDYATILKTRTGKVVLFEATELARAAAAGLTVTVETIHRARERKLRQLKGGIEG